MTVEELVTELLKLDWEQPVMISNDDDGILKDFTIEKVVQNDKSLWICTGENNV